MKRICHLLLPLLAAGSALGQGPAFQTPGMPRQNYGQTDRFSNEFNPAFGFVLDTIGDYAEVDGGGDDGFDVTLRSFEFATNAWVDPSAWAYASIVADEDDIELEEAAVHYVGWDSKATLRAGRFFVDFGKQMQAHVHDLATIDRPAVLREYLGEELAGDGVQFDNWFTVGDESAVRYSLAVFDSLEAHDHDGDEGDDGIEELVDDRQDIDELAFTARMTGFTDVGANGVLQVGLSARSVPDFSLELDSSGADEDNLENVVYGLDLTYGWTDDSGQKTWTFGGEYLLFDGDIGAEVDEEGTPADDSDDTIDVFDDDVSGFYAWGDHAWDPYNSAGVLWSRFEHPESGEPEDDELSVYYTRNLTEFQRLRFGVTLVDSDEDDDELVLAIQYTNYLGPHAHGVNW